MIDNQIPLSDFCTALQKNMEAARGKRKDEIDVLRTAFWYAKIAARLHGAIPAEIEDYLEPDAFFEVAKGYWAHKNKWSKYRVGLHVPRNLLATRADELLPGSKAILNHVLWLVLKMKYPAKAHADDWLKKLDPAIQQHVFKSQDYGVLRVPISRRLLRSLERKAGLDALACLTILLCESSEQGESPLSIDIGQAIYRMLLVLGNTDRFADFIEIIFDVYRDRIFPLAKYKKERFELERANFSWSLQLLATVILRLEASNTHNADEPKFIGTMYKVLYGRYGFDLKFALDPQISGRTIAGVLAFP